MTIYSLLALAGAMFILAITPGPGVFATVARSLSSGFSHAALVVAGIVCGDVIFLLFAIYGLSSIADMLGDFFTLVKYAGSLYLIYIGLRIWFSQPEAAQIKAIGEISRKKNFTSGLIITLSNPKVILFYLGFLPTFLDLQHLSHTEILLTAGVVSLVLGAVLLGYGYAADRARTLFTSQSSLKTLNRGSGILMMGTGSFLLTSTTGSN